MTDDQFPEGAEIIRIGDPQGRGGLYNLIFPGGFDRGAVILPLIGINYEAAAAFRFRDTWIERHPDDRYLVHVYTRIGGGNREDYVEAITVLRGIDGFVRDADDTYDSTYASFWFQLPDVFIEMVKEFALDPVDTEKRWEQAYEAMERAAGK